MKLSLSSLLLLLLCIPVCAGCGGHDLDVGEEDGGPGGPEASPAGSCATLTWGQAETPSAESQCQSMVVGRWTLCGDDAGTLDASSSLGFTELLPQPAGIEFAQENGALDFYMLVAGDGGGLVRTQDPALRGTAVDGFLEGGGCAFWMSPDSTPGDQTGWTLVRFDNPTALLINGSASYVVAPPAP